MISYIRFRVSSMAVWIAAMLIAVPSIRAESLPILDHSFENGVMDSENRYGTTSDWEVGGYPQNSTPASDLTATYTWSKDLATFLANGPTDGANTTVNFTTQADTPSPGITTVTAMITGTATAKLFVRVNVTQP